MKKFLFIASFALSLTAFSQKISNKLTFQKGQKLEMITETKKTSTMELMGQPMESKLTSTMTESFDVEAANADSATMEHKVKHLVFTLEGRGQTQNFDSEKESDRKGDIGKMLDKGLKNKYTTTINSSGNIMSVKTADDNVNANQNGQEEAMAGLLSSQLGLNLGLPKSGSASPFKILPANEVAPGDTWVDTADNNGIKRSTTYKVNKVTASDVVIDYAEEVTINSTQQIMGVDATINSTDKTTGQITLDKNTGLLKQKTANIESKGVMEGQGMTIPSTGKTTVTITVKPA